MARKRNRGPSGLRGWVDIGGDVCWQDYGGRWARRASDGSWYVLDFTNMIEACGRDAEGEPTYVCEVMRISPADLDDDRIKSALACVGSRLVTETPVKGIRAIVSDSGDVIALSNAPAYLFERVIVEACVSYGCVEPLDSFRGNRAANVRANARRAAETLMRDAKALETRLERPVNRIGQTAREYARGEMAAALDRMPEGPAKTFLNKMRGMPTLGGGTFGEK